MQALQYFIDAANNKLDNYESLVFCGSCVEHLSYLVKKCDSNKCCICGNDGCYKISKGCMNVYKKVFVDNDGSAVEYMYSFNSTAKTIKAYLQLAPKELLDKGKKCLYGEFIKYLKYDVEYITSPLDSDYINMLDTLKCLFITSINLNEDAKTILDMCKLLFYPHYFNQLLKELEGETGKEFMKVIKIITKKIPIPLAEFLMEREYYITLDLMLKRHLISDDVARQVNFYNIGKVDIRQPSYQRMKTYFKTHVMTKRDVISLRNSRDFMRFIHTDNFVDTCPLSMVFTLILLFDIRKNKYVDKLMEVITGLNYFGEECNLYNLYYKVIIRYYPEYSKLLDSSYRYDFVQEKVKKMSVNEAFKYDTDDDSEVEEYKKAQEKKQKSNDSNKDLFNWLD